jgi:hypothetical protein
VAAPGAAKIVYVLYCSVHANAYLLLVSARFSPDYHSARYQHSYNFSVNTCFSNDHPIVQPFFL